MNNNRYIPIHNLSHLENNIKNQFLIKTTSTTTNNNNSYNITDNNIIKKDNNVLVLEEWDNLYFNFKKVVLFVRRVCEFLSLSSTTYFHAVILFKRFISKVPLKNNNIYLVAISCILICIKVNPSSMLIMKVRDILNVSYFVLTNEKLLINDNYYNFKDNVLAMEKKVLIALEFNISISINNDNSIQLPHSYLFHFLLFLDFEKDHIVSQISLNFLNDSLLVLFIQSPYFQPEEIALYSILLSLEFTKNILKLDKTHLYDILGITSSNNSTKTTTANYNKSDVDNKFNIFKDYLNSLYSEISKTSSESNNNNNNNIFHSSNNTLVSLYDNNTSEIKDFFKKLNK